MAGRQQLPNPPSVVEGPLHRYLIFEAPNDANLPLYITELKKHACVLLVRACDATYSEEALIEEGITVAELSFADGTAPPDNVVSQWLKLLTSVQAEHKKSKSKSKPCIAVHCVAGLGRAPILCAIAMVESGMDPLNVIKELRQKRPGSLNMPQLRWLQQYKRRGGKKCCIM